MSENNLDIQDPLCKQAMLNLGYIEEDLLIKTREQVIKESVIPREFLSDKHYYIDQKLEFLEEKRQELINIIKDEMFKIENYGKSVQGGSLSQEEKVKKQQEFMEKLKEKQNKIIEGMKNRQMVEIEYEVKKQQQLQEMIQNNKIKEMKLLENQQKKQEEIKQKQLFNEQQQQIRETKKQQYEIQMQEEIKQTLKKYKEQEERQQQMREHMEKERKQQALQREQHLQQKMNDIQNKLHQLEKTSQEQAQFRQSQREMKLFKMQENKEQELKQKIHQNQQKRFKIEQQIDNYKQNEERTKQEIQHNLEQKIYKLELKRQEMECRQQQNIQQKRQLSEQKANEIRTFMNNQEQLNQQKKDELDQFMQEIERKQVNLERQKQRLMMQKSKVREHKFNKNQNNIFRMTQSQEKTNKKIMMDLQCSIEMTTMNRERHLHEVKKKYIKKLIQLEEVQKNLERLQRKEDYQKQQIKLKQEGMEERMDQYQKEKEYQYQQKQKIKKEIEKEKQKLLLEYNVSNFNTNQDSKYSNNTFFKKQQQQQQQQLNNNSNNNNNNNNDFFKSQQNFDNPAELNTNIEMYNTYVKKEPLQNISQFKRKMNIQSTSQNFYHNKKQDQLLIKNNSQRNPCKIKLQSIKSDTPQVDITKQTFASMISSNFNFQNKLVKQSQKETKNIFKVIENSFNKFDAFNLNIQENDYKYFVDQFKLSALQSYQNKQINNPIA